MPIKPFLLLPALLLATGLAPGASSADPHSTGASTPLAGDGAASAACPGRAASSPRDAGHASSKLRHVPAEGDPCATSLGLGRPVRRLAPASGPA